MKQVLSLASSWQVQAVESDSRALLPRLCAPCGSRVVRRELAFGLPLAAARANERIDTQHGPIHLHDAFAMANLRLCSLAAAGKKSRATPTVSRNCAPDLRATIGILEPTLVISQGKDLRPT